MIQERDEFEKRLLQAEKTETKIIFTNDFKPQITKAKENYSLDKIKNVLSGIPKNESFSIGDDIVEFLIKNKFITFKRYDGYNKAKGIYSFTNEGEEFKTQYFMVSS